MTRNVFCITGKAGVGKDTVADYMCQVYGFRKYSLAEPIKKGIKEMFLLDDEWTYSRKRKEEELPDFPGWSPRKLYQSVGTDWARDIVDKDVWLKILNKRMKKDKATKVALADVRFPNEISNVQGSRKIVIKVHRKGFDGVVGTGNHESEQYDLDADYEIHNNSSFEGLYDIVDDIMKYYSFKPMFFSRINRWLIIHKFNFRLRLPWE